MGFQTKFVESRQPSDYETNIATSAAENYSDIITVGALMGNATASKAKPYPDIKFAIVDNADAISGLANVTSLMFAEGQVGFLAGVLVLACPSRHEHRHPAKRRRRPGSLL
jgi:basic membrane protein A